jgi:guanylate kinase
VLRWHHQQNTASGRKLQHLLEWAGAKDMTDLYIPELASFLLPPEVETTKRRLPPEEGCK